MACYGCGRIHCICPLVGKGTWSCRLLCSFLWKLTSNLSLSFSLTPHTLSSLWPLLDQHIRDLTTREGKFLRETGRKSWQDKIRNEVISGTSREWLKWNLWREYSNGLQDRRYFIYLFIFFRVFQTSEDWLPPPRLSGAPRSLRACLRSPKKSPVLQVTGSRTTPSIVRVPWDQPALRQRAFLWLLMLLVLVKDHKGRGRPRKSMILEVHKMRVLFATHKGLIYLTWS